MNRTLAILLLLLSVLFTACQSDEPAIDDGGGKTDGKDLGYIAVNIVQPASVGSRAGGTDNTEPNTGGFEFGSEEENTAKDATFFIFDNSGCKSVQTITLDKGDRTGETTPAVECIYKAVLVIDGIKNEEKYGGEIFCVLNAPSNIKSMQQSAVTKNELMGKIGAFGGTKGAFVMTNSAYKENEAEVCGTTFTANDLKKSAADAIKEPIKIYVERVVAKVIAKKGSSFNQGVGNPAEKGQTPDSLQDLTIKITGIEIANIADKAYLFKNLGGTWPSWSAVHDVTNKRSYWETTPPIEGTNALGFTNKSYLNITNNQTAPTDNVYSEQTNLSLSDCYILPNTTSGKETAILVTAQLMKGEGDDAKPVNLVWIKGGYFLDYSAKSLVCTYLNSHNYAIKTVTTVSDTQNTEYRTINPGDLEWSQKNGDSPITALKPYQACAQVKSDLIVVKYNFDTKTGITSEGNDQVKSVNDFLAETNSYYAEVFKDGLCYYYKNIEQTPVLGTSWESEQNKKDGVVRNHVYYLSLDGINGIGTAVFDPTKDIIPERPNHDDLFYLAASVRVLKWKVVKQSISFEGN